MTAPTDYCGYCFRLRAPPGPFDHGRQACGCATPTQAAPGALTLQLLDRWSTGQGATVPEARWFIAAWSSIDDHRRVAITRLGPRSFVVWVVGPLDEQQTERLQQALRIVRNSGPGLQLQLVEQQAERGEMIHASGDCVCARCGFEYRQHPPAFVGVATLVRDCSGQRWKL